jgi:hypothetical protein
VKRKELTDGVPEGVYLAEDDLLLGGEEGVEVLLRQAGEGFTQRLLQLFLPSQCTGYFKRWFGYSTVWDP